METLILQAFEIYSKKNLSNQVLRKHVKHHNSQNVNRNRSISTFTDTFWCQLVLIIEIGRLRDLKHQHLAGVFFLALTQDSSFVLSELSYAPGVLKCNQC